MKIFSILFFHVKPWETDKCLKFEGTSQTQVTIETHICICHVPECVRTNRHSNAQIEPKRKRGKSEFLIKINWCTSLIEVTKHKHYFHRCFLWTKENRQMWEKCSQTDITQYFTIWIQSDILSAAHIDVWVHDCISKNDDYSIALVRFRFWRISLQFHLLAAWHFDWWRNHEERGKTKIDNQNAFNFDKKRSLYPKSTANARKRRIHLDFDAMICNAYYACIYACEQHYVPSTICVRAAAISFKWNIIS